MRFASLGFVVAYAGTAAASPDHDVNGDGFDDAIIGRSALYLGSAHGLIAAKQTPHSPRNAWLLESSVAIVGDVNGDGFADVVFGDPACPLVADDIGTCDLGQIYLFLGGPKGLATTPVQTISAKANNTWFGAQVIAAGDVNGDHHADIAVVDHDGVHVYLGTATGFAVTPIELPGTSVFAIGDLDHDGKTELLAIDHNVATVYYGGNPKDSAVVPTGGQDELAAAGHGDFDGDGFGDLAITVVHRTTANEVLIFRGSAKRLVAQPVARLTFDHPRAHFGSDFASVGDLDGDGHDDLVIEASCSLFDAKANSCNGSAARVFLGSASGLAARPIATLTPARTNMSMAAGGLTALGDVDGHKHSGFAVGAYVYRGAKGGLASTTPPSL